MQHGHSLSFTQGHAAKTSELKTHDATELTELNTTDCGLSGAFSQINTGFTNFIFLLKGNMLMLSRTRM